MCYVQHKTIFLVSVVTGVLISVYVNYWYQLARISINRLKFDTAYHQWLQRNKVRISPLSLDDIRYGNERDMVTESKFLFEKINVTCISWVRTQQHLDAVNDTWAANCNHFHNFNKSSQTNIFKWKDFCDQFISLEVIDDWVLITNDFTYVLLSNLRLLLTFFDAKQAHYLGKIKNFWNLDFNEIEAGLVLSSETFKRLRIVIRDKDICNRRHHNRKIDYILGNILDGIGIKPGDTKDSKNLTTFHTANLNAIVGKISPDCCSRYLITFNAMESSKLYTYYYLLEILGIFENGNHGNKPRRINKQHEKTVWQRFVKEQGIDNFEKITSDEYFNLWVQKLEMPYFHKNYNYRNSKGKQFRSTFYGEKRLLGYKCSENYTGEWKNGSKSGQGSAVYENRDLNTCLVYDGDWSNDQWEGQGRLSWKNLKSGTTNLKYVGNFSNGQRNGYGVSIGNDDEYFYEGHFSNGYKSGLGKIIFWNNCVTYYGFWQQNQYHGFGILHEKNKIYEGYWQKGLQHGNGKLIWLSKGVIQEGIWNQGSAIKSCIYGFPENQFPKLELAQT